MTEQAKNSKTKDAIYIILLLILIGAVAYLGYQMGQTKTQLSECGQEKQQLESDKEDLNQILKSTGIVDDAANMEVKENLEAMLAEYGKIESDNSDLNDSIFQQKQKIQSLLVEIEELNSQKKKDWGKIYKLKKESETLREIMKGYIHTIDSLNTLNIGLQNTIVEKDQKIDEISNNLNDLQSEKNNLQNTVALGSMLQAAGLNALAIKIKSGGAQKETNRANRTDQIKACFTVVENKIAKAENKTLYMRIITPDAQELVGESPVYFDMGNGKEGKACIGRKINYQNQDTDVCIYYELENEIGPGTYIVEIYCEGNRMGKTSFALK